MQELPRKAKVVVIGAGFAGCATAWGLTRLGISDVVVLEREYSWGVHASGRNAAMCRALVEDEKVSDYTIAGAAFLRNPPPGFCDAPLLRPTGSLLLCQSGMDLANLARRAQLRGIPHEIYGTAAVLERFPRLSRLRTAGGVFFPDDGVIDVHSLLQCYVSRAREQGVQFCLSTPVSGFREGGSGIAVTTQRGEIRASCVVDAAGAWAGQIAGWAGARSDAHGLQALRRHLFLTESAHGFGDAAPLVWYLGDEEFYFRPEGEGILLSACDEERTEPGDVRVDDDALSLLADKLGRVVPELADLRVARSWACLRTFTADRRPLIGWDRGLPWLFWAAGLGGHGATGSAALGREAAKAIAERL